MEKQNGSKKKPLTEIFWAGSCVKRVGRRHAQFLYRFRNGHVNRSREHAHQSVEANHQMECYKPLVAFRKKPEDENGTQHLLDRYNDKGYSCFRFERCRLECNGTQHYKFNKKIYGTDVNSKKVVAAKFKQLKEDICRRKAGGDVGGSNHAMEG